MIQVVQCLVICDSGITFGLVALKIFVAQGVGYQVTGCVKYLRGQLRVWIIVGLDRRCSSFVNVHTRIPRVDRHQVLHT